MTRSIHFTCKDCGADRRFHLPFASSGEAALYGEKLRSAHAGTGQGDIQPCTKVKKGMPKMTVVIEGGS